MYKKNVIERTRDLIYLKFVATDLFLKIISPSAGENSGGSAYPLLFCSFCLAPDRSNYSPLLPHPLLHSGSILQESLQARPFTKPLRWILILHCCCVLLQNLVGNSGETQCLQEAEQQTEASVDVPYPPLQIVNSVPSLSSLCSLSQSSLFFLSTISSNSFSS